MIRDTLAACIAASKRFIPHVMDAPTAEAQTLMDGLLLAPIGANKFTIQTDCVQVVKTMNNGGNLATSAAPIHDEC